jgi:3-deoxy-D-manno-octulosonic-acid transferase
MPYLLNAAYLCALFLLSPYLLYKSLTTRKYRRGFADKFLGRAFHRESTRPCVWFHGVSVGEIHLLKPLLAEFRRRYPDCQCVISTTTDTGYDEACKRFPDLTVFFWPLDFSWAVRQALRGVNPTMIVLAESELWPNFLTAAQERGVPVVVVNGRMSPKSFANWQRLMQPKTWGWKAVGLLARPVVRRLFATVDAWAVQTQEYALYYSLLGIAPERIHVTGNVKYDGAHGDRDNPHTRELGRLFGVEPGDLVWIAGSTQEPEEATTLDIYQRLKVHHPRLRLFLVPRQKERFEEVARLLASSGVPYLRRSQMNQSRQLPSRVASDSRSESATLVVLGDTFGELSALWGLADVAFVGGSLDGKRGGQNMIEPASYGAAVLFGPHTWNFRDTVERLLGVGGAMQIEDGAALEREVARLLTDAEARQRLGAAARAFVASQNGATRKTVDLFAPLLHVDSTARRAA